MSSEFRYNYFKKLLEKEPKGRLLVTPKNLDDSEIAKQYEKLLNYCNCRNIGCENGD